MLSGLIRDGSKLPAIELHTLVGQGLIADWPATTHHVDPEHGWLKCFCELVDRVDAVLIIAPEFGRILETLARCAEESGKLHLGCSSNAIAATADKWTCGKTCWESQGVATPEPVLFLALPPAPPRDLPYPIVLKPRDGAGSLATVFIPNANSWARAVADAGPENLGGQWIAQAFVPGQPASVACMVHPNGVLALPAVAQHLSDDGRFRYQGGELPLPPVLTERAQRLARRAVAAIEGLRGYVGVDMVLGHAQDGSDDRAIEINPRITTSYLGLRALCRQNLLGVIVAACQGQPLPELSWHRGTIVFQADGRVWER